jgi:hypothetical protein
MCVLKYNTRTNAHIYIYTRACTLTHVPLLISSNLQPRIPSGLYRSGFPTNTIPVVLTFKNRASYIQDGHTATLQMLHFIYIFFLTNISTEYFKHAAHSPFLSSKCRLFYNATFFGPYIIHILHTVC